MRGIASLSHAPALSIAARRALSTTVEPGPRRLDHLRANHPSIYADCRYSIVEISAALAATQAARLGADSGHARRFDVQRRDATRADDWPAHPGPCFVLAMEVLDNLAHDLVTRRGGATWRQAAFLPTAALRLLDTLHAMLPGHALLAADFDSLPEVSIRGVNAPLVATTEKGSTRDHGTYLVPRGTADIFFPTDFRLLAELHAEAGCGAARPRPTCSSSVKTAEFMGIWAAPGATRTRSGYEPLLSDYSNTSVFLGGCPELCDPPLGERV
ncbi:hypothetical protein F751_1480 [Auxenochlorella protothecoides]|uniref:Protein arginine methyltransferase NDUFAF7 n=1 Tax=Auxenochlorella protothecoides TaxID=3075 RepID=A0A087SJG2_AUXPR|nr:hypothetical protein F751_1480 [Auxenochlorella protothecoides]KFM25866.1 hypothetical protein F751_1480 [Auxenochlorella protothecoides]